MIYHLLEKLKELINQKIFILLAFDKIFQFSSQLMIVFIYRQFIGLSNYANYVFALVFFTVISTISNVGMDRLLMENFSIEKKISKWYQLLYSSIFYKTIFSICIILLVYVLRKYEIAYYGIEFYNILFILSFGLIGQSYLLLDAFCQAKKANIITVKSRITVVIIINIIRILIVSFFNNSFNLFLWTFPIEQLLYILFSFTYGKRFFSNLHRYANFKFDFKFLQNGVSYTLSTLLLLFQLKYVFSVVKLNLTKEFYEYYSLISYLCDITFSIPALLSLYYRPDLARYLYTNPMMLKKTFWDYLKNSMTLSIIVTVFIVFTSYAILTYSYELDFLFVFPLYLYTLIIPLFFLSHIIGVLQITFNSLRHYLLSATLGTIVVYTIFKIIDILTTANSTLIISGYLLSFSLAMIGIPLFIERNKFKYFRN